MPRCLQSCLQPFSSDHTDEMLEEKDGKINDYNEIFAFFQGWKKTMNKRCDNLNYLVVLRARRQLLLERAVGKPGGVRLAGKMAGDKDNIFFFMLHSPTEAQLKRQIAGAIS